MGYDPFWPTSLATVNVLVVPACPIPAHRFNDIFNSLRKVSRVDLCDVDLEGTRSDLVLSTKPQEGSILFNYSKSVRYSSAQRFPLELNADPQIVFGIYDDINTVADLGDAQDDGQPDGVPGIVSRFQSRFDPGKNGCTSILLAIGWTDLGQPQSVIRMKGIDEEAVYTALKTAAGLFVRNVIALKSKLTDIQLEDPHSLAKPINGDTPRASHDASRSSLPDRTNGQQSSQDPAQIAIQVRFQATVPCTY